MTEIAIRQSNAMTIPDKMRYAEALANSNLLPRHYQRQPANLLLALEYAESLGISPISAITGIFVVEGKPSASADLIASLVRRAGHRLRVTGDDSHAVAQLIRADDPEFTYEARWDMAKARAASLASKNVWKQYPAAMLRSRAITEVARMGASDALFGVIYTPEELGASVDGDGAVVTGQAPPPAAPPAPQASGTDRLRAAISSPPSAEQPQEPVKATAERGDPLRTEAQSKALHAGLGALQITDRDAGLAYISQLIGRDVESTKELTRTEASKAIDLMKAAQDEINADIAPEPPADEPADNEWPEVAPAGAR